MIAGAAPAGWPGLAVLGAAAVDPTWLALAAAAMALWALRGPIEDLAAGLVLRASGVAAEGARLRVEEGTGRVVEVGWRALTLRRDDGDLQVIPFATLSRVAVRLPQAPGAARAHTFRFTAPAEWSLDRARAEATAAALENLWTSVTHPPEVTGRLTESGALEVEVTLYLLDDRRAPDVERACRARLL